MNYEKDFDGWIELKKFLSFKSFPTFQEREIWWCSIGINVGFEIDGKNDQYLRPVLIFRKFNKNIFLGVPLTSKKKNTLYNIPLVVKNKTSYAIINQIRVLDANRLIKKMAKLTPQEFNFIEKKAKTLLRMQENIPPL